MDPEDLPTFLDKIHTTKDSRVDILRLVSSQGVVTEAFLDDDGIENELVKINESIVKPCISTPASASSWGPFALL